MATKNDLTPDQQRILQKLWKRHRIGRDGFKSLGERLIAGIIAGAFGLAVMLVLVLLIRLAKAALGL